jgi:outer membrane protein OmpA-like peptidoglycan-associated protein
LIWGHTDTVGSEAANVSLAQARADAARNALEKSNVPSASIETFALGEHSLPHQTPDNRPEQRNRSVVVALGYR